MATTLSKGIMKSVISLILLLCPFNLIIGQQTDNVKFNHLSFALEYKDLNALQESSFVKDTLGVFETIMTNIDSTAIATKCLIYGQSNYLELIVTSEDDPNLGFLTIGLSVDKINGLQELKRDLDKSYLTFIRTFEKSYDDLKIPWYEVLNVIDTSIINSDFMTQSHFWFFIMGYKTEYFDYNGYTIENDELTRENYLARHSTIREDRIIRNFTGIGLKLNEDEKKYLTRFMEYIGFKKINETEFLSFDNFRFLINERPSEDQNALEFIEFETSEVFSKKEIKISDHISVSIQGNTGQIFIF